MITITEGGKTHLRKYFSTRRLSPLRVYMNYG